MDSNENCQEEKEIRTIFDCVPPRSGAILTAIIADILADGLDAIQIAVIASSPPSAIPWGISQLKWISMNK